MSHRAVRGKGCIAHLGLCAVFALQDVQICWHRNRPGLTSIWGCVIPRQIQLSNPQWSHFHSIQCMCSPVPLCFMGLACPERHSAKPDIGSLHPAFSRCFSNHVFCMWHIPLWYQQEEFGAAPLPTSLSPIH